MKARITVLKCKIQTKYTEIMSRVSGYIFAAVGVCYSDGTVTIYDSFTGNQLPFILSRDDLFMCNIVTEWTSELFAVSKTTEQEIKLELSSANSFDIGIRKSLVGNFTPGEDILRRISKVVECQPLSSANVRIDCDQSRVTKSTLYYNEMLRKLLLTLSEMCDNEEVVDAVIPTTSYPRSSGRSTEIYYSVPKFSDTESSTVLHISSSADVELPIWKADMSTITTDYLEDIIYFLSSLPMSDPRCAGNLCDTAIREMVRRKAK